MKGKNRFVRNQARSVLDRHRPLPKEPLHGVPTYPDPERSRLGSVKEELFNPRLFLQRKIQMDHMKALLPDEHCQTSTTLKARDFKNIHGAAFKPFPVRFWSNEFTETGWAIRDKYNTALRVLQEGQIMRELHDRYLANAAPLKRDQGKTKHDSTTPDFVIDGVAVRMLRPEIRDWRRKYMQ